MEQRADLGIAAERDIRGRAQRAVAVDREDTAVGHAAARVRESVARLDAKTRPERVVVGREKQAHVLEHRRLERVGLAPAQRDLVVRAKRVEEARRREDHGPSRQRLVLGAVVGGHDAAAT